MPNLADALELSTQGDSLDTVELVMELEEELDQLGLSISDEDAEQIQSVQDLIRWLRHQRPDQQP